MKDRQVIKSESYKVNLSSSEEEGSDEEKDVKLHNTQFFNNKINQMRKLGILIPNGFEEDRIAGKKKKNMQGQSLETRLRFGLRKLLGMAEK